MTNDELLCAAPRRLASHEMDEESGHVVVLQPRFRWRWLERLLAPSPDKRFVRIHLDALGSFVWQRLDGEAPLGDVVRAFGEAFPAETDPAHRVLVFVRQLLGTGLVTLGR